MDYFVLVEATTTHSGEPKPILRDVRPDLIEKYSDKLLITTVDDLPRLRNRWIAEINQRNAIARGLDVLGLAHGDIVFISDVDEVPDPHAASQISVRPDQVIALSQSLHFYCFDLAEKSKWDRARAVGSEAASLLSPQELRMSFTTDVIENAGWHFSYFSPSTSREDSLRLKLKSFSHSEWSDAETHGWPQKKLGVWKSHLGGTLLPYVGALPGWVKPESPQWSEYFLFPEGPSRRDVVGARISAMILRIFQQLRLLTR